MCPRLQPLTRCNLDSAAAARSAVPAIPPLQGGAAEPPQAPRKPAAPGRSGCRGPPAPPRHRPPPTPRTLTFVLCQLCGPARAAPLGRGGRCEPSPVALRRRTPRAGPGPCCPRLLPATPRRKFRGRASPRRAGQRAAEAAGRAGLGRCGRTGAPARGRAAARAGVGCPAAAAA